MALLLIQLLKDIYPHRALTAVTITKWRGKLAAWWVGFETFEISIQPDAFGLAKHLEF
jgi:hypothetical protein